MAGVLPQYLPPPSKVTGVNIVTPLRRLAIATSNTEECVRFYTEVFGMKKFYDDVMTNAPGVKSLLGPEGRFPQRLVSMQTGDSVIGMMGFLEYLNASFTVRPFDKKDGAAWRVIVEFLVKEIEATIEKVKKTGQPIVCGPLIKQSPDAKVAAASFVDPNGVLVQAICYLDGQPDSAPVPSAIRRVVIPVARGRAEPSSRLFHESLKMDISGDEIIESGEDAALLGLSGKVRARIITLKQGTENQGMIGFMEFQEPEIKVEPFVKRENYPYEVVLVFSVDDIDRVLSKALPLGGRLMGRRVYEVPGRGMVEGAMFMDANGIVVDLTRWLDTSTG